MSFIFVRDAMKDKLAAAVEPVKVMDTDGTVLGYFTPSKPEKIDLGPDISEEEMDRRMAEGGRPLKDIMADLQRRA